MTKRKGGQTTGDKKWLVLIESTKTSSGYTHNCGTEILAAQVAHAVWDGPFPLSGSGRVHYETVPYCPHCEEEPNFHGTPIQV